MIVLKALHTLLPSGRHGEHPVCHDGERFVMWHEFAELVARHAAGFSDNLAHRWLLATDRPLDFCIQFLALLHAGKQVVIPPNTQPGTLAQLAGAFDAIASAIGPGEVRPLLPYNPQTAVIDLYTSGSTGTPKKIARTLAQFEAEISVLECVWGDTLGATTIVATAPHHHIYGLLFRILWPLSAGRPFDCITCANPDILTERLSLLGKTSACALISSPAQLSRLPQLLPLRTLQPTPKMIFSSGGPLAAATAIEFHLQLGLAPTEVFGSTETGGIAWRQQSDSIDQDSWTPLPGIHITAAPDSALVIRSPFLGNTDPWRMDDAAELRADGRFRLLGRLDRIVKIEEKRLSLPALEARLCEHPWIASAATVALQQRRQRLGALLTLTPEGIEQLARHGRRATTQHLRHHLAAHFETVLLPRQWRFTDQLPLNERGKLTESALREFFADPDELTLA